MVRVLIVAKTRMGGGVCVGGLNLETNQGVRLLRQDGSNQPTDTHFNIGQIWNVDFHPRPNIIPPHTEDVIVDSAQYIGRQPDLRNFLMQRIQPWIGGLEQLFDGFLTSDKQSAYLSKYVSSPTVSTGFWLPDTPLKQAQNPKYYIVDVNPDVCDEVGFHDEIIYIPYVGFSPSIPQIPANTLVRVSLARWWKPTGKEEGCYLQLSGWYL